MCGKNKLHSVTEGTRESANLDVFCAVSRKKFSILLLFRMHYDCLASKQFRGIPDADSGKKGSFFTLIYQA
jgi:hypothetical protein